MKTQSLPPAAGEAAHKSQFHSMTLVEGFRGISRKLVWEYRGQRIEQVYRTHDVRNKTHNGFAWHVLFNDGTVVQDLTRAQAKARIDAWWDDNPAPTAMSVATAIYAKDRQLSAVAETLRSLDQTPADATQLELPSRVKFLGTLLVSEDEGTAIGTFHNVQGRADYREAILRRLNKCASSISEESTRAGLGL